MIRSLILLSVLFMPSIAAAADTVTYTYDALGRLVAVSNTGGPNDGVDSAIAYDPAGNRTSYGVTGVKPKAGRAVILPLNGYTVIVLPAA